MSVIVRGAKNAFRSGIRASAVVLILAISLGLALSMLLANQAVQDRIENVKRSIGTAIIVNPAGSANFQGGGEPLKNEDVQKLGTIGHVSAVTSSLNIMMTTEGQDDGAARPMIGGIKMGETSLQSSIDPGTLGKRGAGGPEIVTSGPVDFKLPVRAVGINGARNEQGNAFTMTSGRTLEPGDANSAILGKGLAEKNNLTIGSTFKAYNETFTVVGIFDTGSQFNNDSVYMPLATAQRLSESGTEITNAVVTADSVENVEAIVADIKNTLGQEKADITTNDPSALTAVESLRTVEKVSLIGFVAALAAAAVIIFLAMLMIVRERRREIGVLKAIGAGNAQVVGQFIVEAVVLVALGAVLGFGLAALGSNSIAGALVNSTGASGQPQGDMPGTAQGAGFKAVRFESGSDFGQTAQDLVGNVTTNVGWETLLYGLLAALAVAIVGSAIPAWFVTKVRPAEVLRGE